MAVGVAPTGTVTFLFTDIEGSTRLWEDHPAEMRAAVARHDELVRTVIARCGGYVFTTAGDAFAAAFPRVRAATDAATMAQRALAAEPWPAATPIRVRMGLHTGEAEERDGDYFGTEVNRAARVMSAAHGGQVVLSSVTASLAPPLDLCDLGEHELRDLRGRERLWQLVIDGDRGDFPPPRTAGPRRHNLPSQRTELIGRDRELARIDELLRDHRLVTLTGVGGTGKTRLALAAAGELLDRFGDGVFFVDLAAVADGDLLAQTVADAAGLKLPVDRVRGPVERVAAEIGDRSVLVVLDNCEHVVDDAAAVADALLDAGAAAHVLATSREALDVDGEQVVHVPSLAWSSADGVAPAVRLLRERAAEAGAPTAVVGDVEMLVELCERVDGIPLAIELVAVQLRHLPPAVLLDQLDDRFRVLVGGRRLRRGRQQTLAAMMDWSWSLLDDRQRRVLADASVFAGGFGPDGVGAVSGLDGVTASQVIGELVAKSLIVPASDRWGARYRLLETVRLYGLERLAEAGRLAEARDAHASWLADRCDAASFEEQWLSARHAALMRREFDNVRAALDRLTDTDRIGQRARIIRSCCYLFREDYFRDEALRWTTGTDWSTLTLADHARMMLVTAEARFVHLDYAAMRAAGFRAYELAVEAGDDAVAAAGLMISCEGLAIVDPDAARPRVEESIERAQRAGAPRVEAVCRSMGLIGNDARRWPGGGRDEAARMAELAGPDGLDHECAVTAAARIDLAADEPRTGHRRYEGLIDDAMQLGLTTSAARLALSAACVACHIPDEALFRHDVQLAVDEFHRAGVHRAAADLVMVLGYWEAVNGDPATAAGLLATARRQPLFDMISYGWWIGARDRVRESADRAELITARARGELADVAATLASELSARGLAPRPFRSLTSEELTPPDEPRPPTR